jgi:hypothetical protein
VLVKSTTTLSDGTYTLADLQPGAYDVTASMSGYASQTKTAGVVAGSTTTLNFALSQSAQQYGSLTGTVTYSTGGVVSGAKVTATGLATYAAVTNSAGVYTINNIPTGTYTVKATVKGSTATKSAIVLPGNITVVNLVLIKGGKK